MHLVISQPPLLHVFIISFTSYFDEWLCCLLEVVLAEKVDAASVDTVKRLHKRGELGEVLVSIIL